MTRDEIAKVAKGLTGAQKRALLACRDTWLNAKEIGEAGSALSALCWYWPKNVSQTSPCMRLLSRDYQDRPLRYIYKLAPDGIAVRDFLRGEDHGAS